MMLLLPLELVAGHVPDDDRFAAALSCRALRDVLRHGTPPRLRLKTTVKSAVTSIPRLRWSLASGCPRDKMCEYAAATDIARPLLEYLRLEDGTCPGARRGRARRSLHDESLEWAHVRRALGNVDDGRGGGQPAAFRKIVHRNVLPTAA